MQLNRFQVRTHHVRQLDGSNAAIHSIFDGVTSQRTPMPKGTTIALAEQAAAKLSAENAHEIALQYDVQPTEGGWQIIDTRRAAGYEASSALSHSVFDEATARELAEYANRVAPRWDISAMSLLGMMNRPRLAVGTPVVWCGNDVMVVRDQGFGVAWLENESGYVWAAIPVTEITVPA